MKSDSSVGVPLQVLEALARRHCLPMPVAALDVHVEAVQVAGVSVQCVGLATTHQGRAVTGAAAALGELPLSRAFYELLERVVIVERNLVGDTGEALQRWSISNGVAVQATLEDARKSAAWELVERDRVLRSWYGGKRPRRLEAAARWWPSELEEHYVIRAYEFVEGLEWEGVRTASVIGLPRRAEVPLSMGFAARPALDDALAAATREFLQQVAFGWGQPVPDACPEEAATPEFHLDFFAYPGNHARLARWLEGEHEGRGPSLPATSGTFSFEELTPAWARGVSVVRAKHPGALRLAFGVGHPLLADLPEFMRVHPIA